MHHGRRVLVQVVLAKGSDVGILEQQTACSLHLAEVVDCHCPSASPRYFAGEAYAGKSRQQILSPAPQVAGEPERVELTSWAGLGFVQHYQGAALALDSDIYAIGLELEIPVVWRMVAKR